MITIEWGKWGFDFQAECARILASLDDMEIRIGSYAVTIQRGRMPLKGLILRGPRGERYWHWDDVKAWIAGRPVTPLDAA